MKFTDTSEAGLESIIVKSLIERRITSQGTHRIMIVPMLLISLS